MSIKTKLHDMTTDWHKSLGRRLSRRYHDYPLGREPRSDAATYLALHTEARAIDHPEVDAIEAELGFAIDREWMEQLALHTQVVIKSSTLCYQHGRLLYAFLRHYVHSKGLRTVTIVETGTARGFSAMCMARALADANVDGRIITFDVLPHDTPMYWNCIDDMDGPKSRRALLGNYRDLAELVLFVQGDTIESLRRAGLPRVHFAFLDAQHTAHYVLSEFQAIESLQESGDVVFFDDYSADQFPGVVEAVEEILQHGYEGRILTVSDKRAYVHATKTGQQAG